MFLILAFGLVNSALYSQEIKGNSSENFPVKFKDTLKISIKDTVKDSLGTKSKDSIIKPIELLESIIDHSADSLIKQDIKKNKIILLNNAHIHYKDIDLTAGYIEINNNTNIVWAKGIKDSIGEYSQLPVFKQGAEESAQDSIAFNFKTERAKIWGLKTEQDGVIIKGEVTKKENDSTIYVQNIKFTTSKKDNPDYYITTKKAKIVPNKKIVIGLSNLVITNVPTPLFLPFAYIPLTKGSVSGFIMPTWGDTAQQGYFLQNGGYYFAINDYVDLAVLGDVYTNGSWGLRTESSYAVKYRFSGNFSFKYENLINSIKGFDDYSKTTNYNIRWSHSQDAKASPNSRFSASVNLGSSTYYRESLNEYNTNSFLNNTLSSSISYYKKFVGTPFNISLSVTHAQNTNTESITMSLPSLQFNMDRIFPFASKSGSKNNALQKLGVTYTLRGDNNINTTDEFFFKKEMFETAKSGLQHNATFSTNMKVFKYFTLSPNANYKEVWYFDRINKTYNAEENIVVTDTLNKFSSYREYSTGVSLSTTIYGMLKFKKGRLQAIRHIIRPNVSYSYRPDFSSFYEEVQQSDDPNDVLEYSPFSNGVYGGPGTGLSNSLNFTLNNTFEAKVMSKDSTKTEAEKITLINNLNFSTSYNMASDSLKWSPVRMNAGTNFFNKKLQLNLNATLDPYAITNNGTKINTFNINNGGSLFRLTNAALTMNYSFSSSKSNKQESKKEQNAKANNSDGIFGENLNNSNSLGSKSDTNNKKVKSAKLYHATFPWKLNLAYSLNYSNSNREREISSNSLMFSGDIELTPKWKVGFSSGYDIKSNGFTYTQLRFSRDLDSWKLNFNWVPFGDRQTYYFFIGVKSSMLSDLKYDKRQVPDRRLF
ncbi:putative LPS assembly protein LptD [Lutibacter sp.]|uniref:putative LPS assembly protein LptD n=1 Tax=Lutibacter sp. TaxID=1925666 RepID=UPI0025BCC486|nr:putative LPS assembly protein LptD [Lutibacter sp.]MCF6168025.1 LPS-assembly protein LptD [Lutibacter sp.]